MKGQTTWEHKPCNVTTARDSVCGVREVRLDRSGWLRTDHRNLMSGLGVLDAILKAVGRHRGTLKGE